MCGTAHLRALTLFVVVAGTLPGTAYGQIALQGRVELPNHTPAADLEVALLPQMTRYELGRLVLEGRYRPEPTATTATGEDGSFALEAPEPGMWKLSVATEGYRPMEYYLLPLLEDVRVPPLELIEESIVEVRVLDAAGEPATGAHVRAEPPPTPDQRRRTWEEWRPAWRQSFADDRGVARLGRGRNEALRIYAHAPGHLEAERHGVTAGTVTIQLGAAQLVELRIVDTGGTPAAAFLARLGERRWPLGLTDESGRFTVPLAERGEQQIQLMSADATSTERWLDPASWRAEEPPEITLHPVAPRLGRLVDVETGAPLAGAWVWLGGRPAAFVTTDPSGGYALPVEVSADAWIWGAATGYIRESQRTASDAPSGPTLGLQKAARARGFVVDEYDDPVGRVEIVARVDYTRRRGRHYGARRQLERDVSAEDGSFAIGSLHPDMSYLLHATKPGYADGELQIPDPRSDTLGDLRFRLETGRVATGTVVGPGREPLAGARVRLERSLESGSVRRMVMSRLHDAESGNEAVADAAGSFAIRDLAAGTYSMEVSAPGYASQVIRGIEVEPTGGSTELGELVLELGVSIDGRVTDVDGVPLEGANVFVGRGTSLSIPPRWDEEEAVATSDAAGFFSVPDRRSGEKVDLRLEMPGYADGILPAVEAPTAQPLRVELERATSLRGRVVDPGGRPIAGAQISARALSGGFSGSVRVRPAGQTVSDEDGGFLVEEVPPGEIQLVTRADGYVTNELSSLVVEAGRGPEDLTITLEPGATISGEVTDASGRPVGGALISLQETTTSFGAQYRSANAVTSDAEGHYKLEGVPPGRHEIAARHDDHPTATREIEVEPGDNALDLAFEPGVEISGRVTDDSGAPVAGAEIGVGTDPMSRRAEVSGSSGDFSIRGLAPGSLTLHVEADGYASTDVDLDVGPAGLSGVDVVLSPGSAIVGQLLGLEAADYAAVQIFAASRPRTTGMGLVDRNGRYRIEDLPPGDYSVSAHLTDGRSASGEVEVLEGVPETVLDLEFELGLTLTGQVLDGADPVTGVMVAVFGVDVDSSAGGLTDHDGRFELRGLEAGRHNLTVNQTRGGLQHREEIDLTRTTDVVVRLASAVVSGRVLDATDSRPLEGVSLRLEPAAQSGPEAVWFGFGAGEVTDSGGFFRFPRTSAGTYRLLAQRDGYAPGELALTIDAGSDQTGLELALEPTEGIRVHVTLPSGAPAMRFFATVADSAGRTVMSGLYNSGEEGARLGIPPGAWELSVATQDAAISRQQISVPGPPLHLTLGPEARLSLRVPALEGSSTLAQVHLIDAAGRPVRGWQWTNGRPWWPLVGSETTVPGLGPGTWTVRVEASDGRTWQGTTSVDAGDNPELVLE